MNQRDLSGKSEIALSPSWLLKLAAMVGTAVATVIAAPVSVPTIGAVAVVGGAVLVIAKSSTITDTSTQTKNKQRCTSYTPALAPFATPTSYYKSNVSAPMTGQIMSVTSVETSLAQGVKQGYMFKESDWFEDSRFAGFGWTKYKVRVDGPSRFEVHYNINELECKYSDLKPARWNNGG